MWGLPDSYIVLVSLHPLVHTGQKSMLGSSLFRSKSRLAADNQAALNQTMPSQRKRQAWQGADAELNYNSEIVRVSGTTA